MTYIIATLVDQSNEYMAPAIINVSNFEIIRLSSIFDMVDNFNPSIVMCNFGGDYRTYSVTEKEGIYFLKNPQAKKAIIRNASYNNNDLIATELLEKDKIIREQKILANIKSNYIKPINKL